MTDGLTVAALLLVVGPIVPGVALSNPALFRVWFLPRDEHLALVAPIAEGGRRSTRASRSRPSSRWQVSPSWRETLTRLTARGPS